MSSAGHSMHHALSPGRERATLLTLGAVQFTHVLDFMIMMPLGAQLMTAFDISPAQFTHLVGAYGFSAAIAGLAGGFFLDRFDRKRSLVTLYAGFVLATLACGLAPTHFALLLARVAAGAFGGLASSMVMAMVGDIVPPERRGRAMSLVGTAFPVASVLGVPAGIALSGSYGWHAPFFLIVTCGTLILALAGLALPPIRTAVQGHEPLRQMGEILSHGVHLRAFAVSTALVMAGGVVVPFIAPSFVSNLGLSEKPELLITYMVGGLATVFTTPLIGQLNDRMDRLRLLVIVSAAAAVVQLTITRLGPVPVAVASAMMAAFMVTMSSRFATAMTMIMSAVGPRHRGGFMSVNAAVQQAASAVATFLAGECVTRAPDGRLSGLPMLGYLSVGFLVATLLLAAQLRAVAPHVATAAPVPAAP